MTDYTKITNTNVFINSAHNAERFDPSTGIWTKLHTPYIPVENHTPVVYSPEKIYNNIFSNYDIMFTNNLTYKLDTMYDNYDNMSFTSDSHHISDLKLSDKIIHNENTVQNNLSTIHINSSNTKSDDFFQTYDITKTDNNFTDYIKQPTNAEIMKQLVEIKQILINLQLNRKEENSRPAGKRYDDNIRFRNNKHVWR